MRGLIAGVAVLALAACSAGAQDGGRIEARGEAGSRSYQVGAFDAVSLAGPHEVIVTVGDAPSVRAQGDPEVLDRLEVRLDGGELEIGTRRRGGMDLNWGDRKGSATVYVTVPALRAANVAGSGTLRIDRVEGERFDASLAGSGDLLVDAMRVDRAEFSVAGSGDIRAAGTANATEISIAGSGDLDLSGLESRTARVSVMGSGDVLLAGGARCTVSKAGSGDVRCG